ncbi:MAG: glutamate-5-semialdehyde dehydrogenase [Selenomonadaceae bacterium]|nr:glutamate-5-semialdehyde dehydrogenase [Selenomonadaceae bacterium]
MTEIKQTIEKKASAAKKASVKLANLSTVIKNEALLNMAAALVKKKEEILKANALDVEAAKVKGVKTSYIDRLTLNDKRIEDMAEGLKQTAALPDPIGTGDMYVKRPNGLEIRRVRVPFGVIGIIYEARPNVTVDAAALCLKSGNACILRGGSEAINSNKCIVKILQDAAYNAGVPEGAIQFIDIIDRDAVIMMCKLRGIIDIIIPRGGAGLIKRVVENSSVNVIETGTGICHEFVDVSADLDMAINIAINAKTLRPSVCNAIETLLIHKDIAEKFLPMVKMALEKKDVELRGCKHCLEICPDMKAATEEDWETEYNDLILSIKIVDSVEAAIEHINKYNTEHSDTIITQDIKSAHKFLQEVDAAAVYVNASTRFTDGFEFGFGAEIGISTQKMHARGPMGLEALTTTKYIIYGEGQVR